MAKGKLANKSGKGQKSLDSFFGGGSKNKSDDSSDTDGPVVAAPAPGQTVKGIAMDLPPIHDIPAIFYDLVSRVPAIKGVAEHVKGRKLRVATMCSGTESPLLALDLICQSLYEQYEIKLDVEHIFSCEIEPFKQAYIERNFHPPLLFRDVCELGKGWAYVEFYLFFSSFEVE
jgi:hypothetical protein